MKIFGALLIVFACALLGYEVYIKALKKLKFTEGLVAGFEFYKNEITFAHTVLSDTLIKCAPFAGEARNFFDAIGSGLNIEGVILKTVFENYSKNLRKFVSEEVFAIVRDTMLQLGTNDTDSQVLLVESAIEKLNCCKLQQSAFCNKEGIMCKKIGVVAGVALSLMFF